MERMEREGKDERNGFTWNGMQVYTTEGRSGQEWNGGGFRQCNVSITFPSMITTRGAESILWLTHVSQKHR